ncbi:homoserine dehydrogenase [Candidatus Calescamantes bacterium]|nr:homoserine dehydrogenase [Candidatus Calescamantes bacterium]
MKRIGVGIIGLGTVGRGVWEIIKEKGKELHSRCNVNLEIQKVCDKETGRRESLDIPSSIFTDSWEEVVKDNNVEIVVELIGGIHPAKEIITSSLEKGKYVVTANKALLAECGEELLNKRGIFFEASVMGGVPVVKTIKEGLVANRIEKILGIINGTTNYLLTRMEEGNEYREALREAQEKGFAEADPTLDVEGWDSAHKLSILAYLSFGVWVKPENMLVEGISFLTPDDIKYAYQLGYTVKLLAIGKRKGNALEIRVHPTLLPLSHPLSGVKEEFNALFLKGDEVGEITLQGKGAGSHPTASAVVSDLVEAALSNIKGDTSSILPPSSSLHLVDSDDFTLRYYIRFTALDKPGVLSRISGILGEKGISISSVVQKGRREGEAVPIIMMTHEAKEKNLKEALEEIDRLPIIRRKTIFIRVENL